MDVTDQFFLFSERFCRAGWIEQRLLLLYMIGLDQEGRSLMALVGVSYVALISMMPDEALFFFMLGISVAAVLFLAAWLAGKRRK